MADIEFYAPFAHIPGRYEWCRILSVTHGSFDCFIVIHDGTDRPVTVYVNTEHGERFMRDRFPESRSIRVPADDLVIEAGEGWLRGELRAQTGPVRTARMRFQAVTTAPRATPYGGGDFPVWGSAWTCSGVDLELDARVEGAVRLEEREIDLDGDPAIVTLGSYGRLERRGP